ncbi:MAG: CvpA family protein [Prevotella sp.]|nr:CvpA family protein [Prevotella sp.]MCM1075405.1 CvpA family protein [Ruminococcus sp.]
MESGLGMIFHLIVIVVLLLAVWHGWRRGVAKQLASLLGLAFGFVAARIFYTQAADMLDPMVPAAEKFAPEPFGSWMREYTGYIVGASVIFIVVYILISLLGSVLANALRVIHTGALNSLLGAVFCFGKWVLLLSIGLNLILVVNPDGTLMKSYTDGDGNVVELVMKVSPEVLGIPGPDEVKYRQQMQEARELDFQTQSQH